MAQRTRQPQVRIRLTCGCWIRTRLNPLNGDTKYGCNSGQGHGYRLDWTEWHDAESGSSRINRSAVR